MTKDYEVGFGRPPVKTRFKSGRSGNPSGRPKKKPTLVEAEAKLLFQDKHALRVNGKIARLNAKLAILNVLTAKALRGDQRAIEYVLKRTDALELAGKIERHPSEIQADLVRDLLLNVLGGGSDDEDEH